MVPAAGPAVSEEARTDCPHCESRVPPGAFCGVCGADLARGEPAGSHRRYAFAAHPGEHLFQPGVVSTLFPHIVHHRSSPFRFGLLTATALLVVLGALRLTGPAIVAAAAALPVLYLLYLYEVEVYEDEPIAVVGATFVLGIVLGGAWALLTSKYVTGTLVLNAAPQGAPLGRVAVAAVLIPLGGAVLMLVGAIALYLTHQFDEALDGFAFGAMGALGFSLATTLVELAPEMRAGLTSSGSPFATALLIVERGLLIPFIYATTTGLIAGALWLRRGRTRRSRMGGWTTSIAATVALAAIVQVALGVMTVYVSRLGLQVLIYGGVALLLLFATRVAIHNMLLAEAVDVPVGPSQPCVHCRHIVPRMAFCPHCGVATRATPKLGAGRSGREVR